MKFQDTDFQIDQLNIELIFLLAVMGFDIIPPPHPLIIIFAFYKCYHIIIPHNTTNKH